MRGNIAIPELVLGEDVWLIVVVAAVRERITQQGKPLLDALARNGTGCFHLRILPENLDINRPLKAGLWGITGRLEMVQDRAYFLVAEYRPINVAQFREHQGIEPPLPCAYTVDIETIALLDFRERVGAQLERRMRLGSMRLEQYQRYLEDIAAEEERSYQLGSLSATSGRVLSIAVHVGPIPGIEFDAAQHGEKEYVFGIDLEGNEQPEKQALTSFLGLLKGFHPEIDEIVGHNILGFDLPFLFQRCLVNSITVHQFVDLSDYHVRGVFDTMHRWWFGAKRNVSLDDIAWAMGIESSKTEEVEGSKVFDLYHAGKLQLIREYNLNDVRVTREVYERMVACFGR